MLVQTCSQRGTRNPLIPCGSMFAWTFVLLFQLAAEHLQLVFEKR